MYIAINKKVFKKHPVRALRFSIRRETLLDILLELEKRPDSEDYDVYYVE